MIVVIPKPTNNNNNQKKQQVYRPIGENDTIEAHWKKNPSNFITLETKTPVWNEKIRAYQLNFRGRVRYQSVKNFQLVDPDQPGRVVLQVGKRHDEEFICDYQYPLNAFQAFAIALTVFDGNPFRE